MNKHNLHHELDSSFQEKNQICDTHLSSQDISLMIEGMVSYENNYSTIY